MLLLHQDKSGTGLVKAVQNLMGKAEISEGGKEENRKLSGFCCRSSASTTSRLWLSSWHNRCQNAFFGATSTYRRLPAAVTTCRPWCGRGMVAVDRQHGCGGCAGHVHQPRSHGCSPMGSEKLIMKASLLFPAQCRDMSCCWKTRGRNNQRRKEMRLDRFGCKGCEHQGGKKKKFKLDQEVKTRA